MERAEEQETLSQLTSMESGYATGGTPSVIETSIIAAFSGRNTSGTYDAGDNYGLAHLQTMGGRQLRALSEMMLCSAVRSNSNLHDLPSQTIACAGLQSLSQIGDSDGAVIGFTERDRQPARLSPTAASAGDSAPIAGVLGQTGSGKTMVLLWLASQFSEMKNKHNGRNLPNIIIDLKQTSDHSPIVKALGGRVLSLDDLATADGIFDPLRFAEDAESGVEMAANMLMLVNPWGPRKLTYETPIQRALMIGVTNGADCIGEALRIALEEDENTPAEMVADIFSLAESSTFFRACVGMQNGGTGLRVADGLTLIKLGRQSLTLPSGTEKELTRSQRVSIALVQMMVYGSAMALAGRKGVLHLDEAWMFLLGEAKAQVEQLGRLARSQDILPILYTQRVTDLVKAELEGYISRLFILYLSDEREAQAACKIAGLEPTEERIKRIRAPRTIGNSATPNPLSMQALRDASGKVIRGSVAIYRDLANRAVPIEIVLPTPFLALSSTNPDDIARRDALAAAGKLKGFEYNREKAEIDEDYLLAPLGRYVADQGTSIFADNSLVYDRGPDPLWDADTPSALDEDVWADEPESARSDGWTTASGW